MDLVCFRFVLVTFLAEIHFTESAEPSILWDLAEELQDEKGSSSSLKVKGSGSPPFKCETSLTTIPQSVVFAENFTNFKNID